MRTLIKNGMIVTTESEFEGDILVEGEKIKAIGENLNESAEEVVNAEGLVVLPGGVDEHTHFNFSFKSATTRGWETSNAAIAGGTTTVVDFCNQEIGKGMIESVNNYLQKIAPMAMCDYSLHGVVFDPSDKLFEEIPSIPEIGVPTIKLFMAYKGMPYHCDDSAVFKALLAAKDAGVTIMVHAENADMIDVLQKLCLQKGQVDPIYHAVSRPPVVEDECTTRAIYLAKAAGAPIFIVHVTSRGAMEAIRNAYNEGMPVFGETCTHYLVLDTECLAKPNFEGAKYVCSPALRSKEHRDALWEAIKKGWLKAVSSDHCGFDWSKQKHLGKGDFTSIPNGAPGLQDRLQVLWTEGVAKGKISRQRFVDLWATAPAKINGLFPRKGILSVGSDADIVLLDPNEKGIITNANSYHQTDYNTYEGMEYMGAPKKVYLRGKLVYDNGKLLIKEGQGKFVPGEPFGLCYRGA